MTDCKKCVFHDKKLNACNHLYFTGKPRGRGEDCETFEPYTTKRKNELLNNLQKALIAESYKGSNIYGK